MTAYVFSKDTVEDARDIAADVLDSSGRLRLMPANYYADTTALERSLFCVRYGVYGLHTQELADWLRTFIAGNSAIEIGAGNGVLAEALGIPATDNHMQTWPHIRALYSVSQQPLVKYGPNVECLDALVAIRRYKPFIVIGSWITHLFRPRDAHRDGNQYAPDERAILAACSYYVMIANDAVHAKHPLLDRPHERIDAPWLYSRSLRGRDFIGIWRGNK